MLQNLKPFLFICILCTINLNPTTAVYSITNEDAGCKCCKTKVAADQSDCVKTNAIRVEATVMTLVKKSIKDSDSILEGEAKYDLDASYTLAYEGTFPVNDVLPIQIMLPESNDYQILVTGLTVEGQDFSDNAVEQTVDLFAKDKTGLAGIPSILKVRCKDKANSNTVWIYFSAGR